MLTQSWRSKSAVFRMYHALTLNGYSNFIKAVKRQRNLGLDHTDYSYSTVDVGVIFVCTHSNYNLENPWFLTLINDSCNWQLGSPRFLCRPTAFCSTCWSRGTSRVLSIRKTADLLLQLWVGTFRGYQILFSIRNPYINRFTNHFTIHS